MGRKKILINPGTIFENKYWRVINEVESRGKARYFLCECLLCNREYEVFINSLKNENKCFCCGSCANSKYFEKKADELIGIVFGRLTVISKHSVTKNNGWSYLCKCECGINKVISANNLKNNTTLSCGCYRNERLTEVNSGENNPFWIDGRTPQNELDRNKIKQSINPIIRRRDNYTCQNCNQYNGYLEVHHIFDFSTYPELRLEDYNLITLCKTCHKDFHSYYSIRQSNTLFDLETWMAKEYKYHNELLDLL